MLSVRRVPQKVALIAFKFKTSFFWKFFLNRQWFDVFSALNLNLKIKFRKCFNEILSKSSSKAYHSSNFSQIKALFPYRFLNGNVA